MCTCSRTQRESHIGPSAALTRLRGGNAAGQVDSMISYLESHGIHNGGSGSGTYGTVCHVASLLRLSLTCVCRSGWTLRDRSTGALRAQTRRSSREYVGFVGACLTVHSALATELKNKGQNVGVYTSGRLNVFSVCVSGHTVQPRSGSPSWVRSRAAPPTRCGMCVCVWMTPSCPHTLQVRPLRQQPLLLGYAPSCMHPCAHPRRLHALWRLDQARHEAVQRRCLAVQVRRTSQLSTH